MPPNEGKLLAYIERVESFWFELKFEGELQPLKKGLKV